MALRMKAGGATSVITAADAKKLGIKVVEKVIKDAGIKNAGDKKTKEEKKVGKENQETENKKPEAKKPTGPAATGASKVKTAVNAVSAAGAIGSKKGKDADEPDPIEESLNLRIKAGGVT